MRAPRAALALLLAAGFAAAQEAAPDETRRLVEQKMRLVEMLVSAQAAKAGAASADRLQTGREALARARAEVGAGRFAAAAQILDEALRSTTASTRAAPPAPLSEDALQAAHQNLIEQVATYRASIEELTSDARSGRAARLLLARIDAKSGEARQHAGAGRLAQANQLLAEAYQLAVGELARLRAGDETVHRLNFVSPVDEFAYEVRRFESQRLLVAMQIADGRVSVEQRDRVDELLARALRLRENADAEAAAGRHKDAVSLMERAFAELNRALQWLGVPVF